MTGHGEVARRYAETIVGPRVEASWQLENNGTDHQRSGWIALLARRAKVTP